MRIGHARTTDQSRGLATSTDRRISARSCTAYVRPSANKPAAECSWRLYAKCLTPARTQPGTRQAVEIVEFHIFRRTYCTVHPSGDHACSNRQGELRPGCSRGSTPSILRLLCPSARRLASHNNRLMHKNYGMLEVSERMGSWHLSGLHKIGQLHGSRSSRFESLIYSQKSLPEELWVPEVAHECAKSRSKFTVIFQTNSSKLFELADELKRRFSGPRAPASSTPMTPELAEEIREYASDNPACRIKP